MGASSLLDQKTLSPSSKQIKPPKRNTTQNHLHNISRQASIINHNNTFVDQNFVPYTHNGGVFLNPHSYRPPFSHASSLPPRLSPPYPPPLLPLPFGAASKPVFSSLPPPKNNNYKKQPNKKSKNSKTGTPTKPSNDVVVVQVPTKQLKDVNQAPNLVDTDSVRVEKTVSLSSNNIDKASIDDDEIMEKFSGLVFGLSPPPSSLPLPRFTLRQPKLSCKAEAAVVVEVDDGATDNLRRLLRLR